MSTDLVKNITLSADEALIEQARLIAHAAFREWLQQYTQQAGSGREYAALMKRLKHVRSGGPFTRDEMNER